MHEEALEEALDTIEMVLGDLPMGPYYEDERSLTARQRRAIRFFDEAHNTLFAAYRVMMGAFNREPEW